MDKNLKKKVKVLKGLYRGFVGTIHDSFMYNGKELYIVKFNRFIYRVTGQIKPGFTTVYEGEFEETNEPETYRECS